MTTFKFKIDPHKESGRDTICQNLRYLHRRMSAAGDVEGVRLVEKCFDFAKRMDARLKYYRRTYEPNRVGPEIKEGHPADPD